MRKLKIFFITLICLLASNVAFTLGVGGIEVKSALSEPLNAEIKLFSVRPGEGENIRVSLATLKEFTAAGVDRPLHLSYLKFKVVEKGDGNAYISIYSERPIREPFLNFIVDIDWPSGRLLREYTLLLDPPIFAQRKAAPIQAPVVRAPAPVVRKEKPAPAPVTFANSPVPTAPVAVSSEDELFPRMDIGASPKQAFDNSPRVISAPAFSGDTYKVKKSETLWSIAESIRPDDSVGVSQMMLALQNANPDAFTNNNINGLKSGIVLRVPDLADIQSISRKDAVQVARQQNEIWRTAQDNLATSATPKGTSSVSPGTSSKATSATTPEEATIKLVTPDSKTGKTQGAGGDDSDAVERMSLATEEIESKSKENDQLQDRVKSLEDQIGSMERLLELKDDSISELQSKLTEPKSTPTPTPTPIVPEVVEEVIAPVVEEKTPEPVEPVVKPVTPDSNKINPYALNESPKANEPVKPAKPAAPMEKTETSIFDDPIILAAMLAVLVALLAIVWLVVQRRRNNMQFPESILSGKPAVSTTTTTPNTETSLLSDFAPSAMDGALESDSAEVDPSAEADVYIAYSKHQQAEELLLTSIKEEPDRLDLRLKLMEVYHATGNAESFLTHATQLNDAMDDQNTALWDKAVVMGRELCPGNALFGTDSAAGEDDFSDLEGIGDLDDDLDLSLDVAETSSAEDADELSLDMELESLEKSTDEDDDLTLEIDELSLEMDELSLDTESETEVSSETEIDFGDLELELDDTDDLELVDTVSEVSTAEPAVSDADESALELDADNTLELDTESAISEDLDDMDIDDAILGMDEVATKLDLAKAYIDMGDPDGARAILDEVLTEGSDDQQTEAKGLIDQL